MKSKDIKKKGKAPEDMTPKEMMTKLAMLEVAVNRNKSEDKKTKKQVANMFSYLRELIAYQVPMKPVEVSDDGHKFKCPRCRTAFDSEDTVDDFYLCYICGQRWRKKGE